MPLGLAKAKLSHRKALSRRYITCLTRITLKDAYGVYLLLSTARNWAFRAATPTQRKEINKMKYMFHGISNGSWLALLVQVRVLR